MRGINPLALPTVLGLAHGVADATSGWLLGGLLSRLPIDQVVGLTLFYNALAFAAQPLVGRIVDRTQRPALGAILGLLLLAVSSATGGSPFVAVPLAGLGSALFHVGGGSLAIAATRERAAGPGLFAAPGVVGLALGGSLGMSGEVPAAPFALALVVLAMIVTGLAAPASHSPALLPEPGGRPPALGRHDAIMVVLLFAIALRSFAWSVMQAAAAGEGGLLLALAVAAGAGKCAGGFLADRVGWRRFAVAALGGAALLLSLSEGRVALAVPGVLLLQSVTPVGIAAVARKLPGAPATAAGLTLGLAIAAGGAGELMVRGAPWAAPAGGLASCLPAAAIAAGLSWWALGVARGSPPAAHERAEPA